MLHRLLLWGCSYLEELLRRYSAINFLTDSEASSLGPRSPETHSNSSPFAKISTLPTSSNVPSKISVGSVLRVSEMSIWRVGKISTTWYTAREAETASVTANAAMHAAGITINQPLDDF